MLLLLILSYYKDKPRINQHVNVHGALNSYYKIKKKHSYIRKDMIQ